MNICRVAQNQNLRQQNLEKELGNTKKVVGLRCHMLQKCIAPPHPYPTTPSPILLLTCEFMHNAEFGLGKWRQNKILFIFFILHTIFCVPYNNLLSLKYNRACRLPFSFQFLHIFVHVMYTCISMQSDRSYSWDFCFHLMCLCLSSRSENILHKFLQHFFFNSCFQLLKKNYIGSNNKPCRYWHIFEPFYNLIWHVNCMCFFSTYTFHAQFLCMISAHGLKICFDFSFYFICLKP
jgi:hypothetical protein